MKNSFYKFTFILLFFYSSQSIAQKVNIDGWKKGYIVMLSGDTICGMIDKPDMESETDDLKFIDGNKKKQKKYDAADIKAFTYNDTLFKYFKYSGWSKLIYMGTIDLYKGHTYANTVVGDKKKMECLVFKKKDQKVKFIGANETNSPKTPVFVVAGGKLNMKTKEYFSEYIADDPESLSEFNRVNFRYEELENLIVKYNERTKIK